MTPDGQLLLRDTQTQGVLILTLNRPQQRNALATPLLEAISAALLEAEQDPSVRCVLVAGSDKVFAAGADIDELAIADGSEPICGPRWNAWSAISSFTKPLVAAVEGWCLGAGMELALRCDIVVAARNAKLGQPETNLGIMPGAGGTVLLPQKIGLASAMDMVLTGEPISGERAYQLGLISRLAENGEARAMALLIAAKLADRAPRALRTAKASINGLQKDALATALRSERELYLGLLGSPEKSEGVKAFREKRPPDWSDF